MWVVGQVDRESEVVKMSSIVELSSLPIWERMIIKAYAKYYFGLISEVELSHILFTAERRRLTNS